MLKSNRDILENNLLTSVMTQQWVFQQDNDPKHTAAIITNCLNKNGIGRFKWPSFFPDMNPIEHLWDEVERRMKKEQPKNGKEFKESLIRVWESIEVVVFKKLVDSLSMKLFG